MGSHVPAPANTTDKQARAKSLVYGYLKSLDETSLNFSQDDIKVVWFCKTLKNWKAMVADLSPGGMFFEVTYNGDKEETYLDAYKKVENLCIKDVE